MLQPSSVHLHSLRCAWFVSNQDFLRLLHVTYAAPTQQQGSAGLHRLSVCKLRLISGRRARKFGRCSLATCVHACALSQVAICRVQTNQKYRNLSADAAVCL